MRGIRLWPSISGSPFSFFILHWSPFVHTAVQQHKCYRLRPEGYIFPISTLSTMVVFLPNLVATWKRHQHFRRAWILHCTNTFVCTILWQRLVENLNTVHAKYLNMISYGLSGVFKSSEQLFLYVMSKKTLLRVKAWCKKKKLLIIKLNYLNSLKHFNLWSPTWIFVWQSLYYMFQAVKCNILCHGPVYCGDTSQSGMRLEE